jgi:hypothetical protein
MGQLLCCTKENLVIPYFTLPNLYNYSPTRFWANGLRELANLVVTSYEARNEVVSGGIVTAGTLAAGALKVNMTALACTLNGMIQSPIAALSDVDLLVKSGDVAQPIYAADGATAAALELGTDETAYVTLIVANTDGAGAADAADNGDCKLIAIVAGDADTYENATAHLTSQEIEAALAASTDVHDGVTHWQHVAQVLFANPSDTPEITVVANRNNHLGV